MTIQEIQAALFELGFRLVESPPTGTLDLPTIMALREFQRYAKMKTLAQEDPTKPGTYVERLSCVANTALYTGFVHGQPDQATTDLLALWQTNKWRCPVVIQAWHLQKGSKGSTCQDKKTPKSVMDGFDNIWLGRELKDFPKIPALKNTAPRVFAYDFSSQFFAVAPGSSPKKTVVGTFTKSKKDGAGPDAEPPNHVLLGGGTSFGAEVRPETLLGRPCDPTKPEELSTFKVVRAVSEVECLGFFDSINGYDRALLSIGLYNWTLGLEEKVQSAELAAFLAYLRVFDQPAFDQTVAVWGVGPEKDWGTDGAALFDHSQKKFTTFFCHQDNSGKLIRITADESPFYRTWHWFYRFQAAARYVDKFRLAMWVMARIRIRDILSTPWTDDALGIPKTPMPAGTTLGDVYSSPLAVAYLLRWHILFPAHVVSQGKSARGLVDAFTLANKPKFENTPDKWVQCNENRLLLGLRKKFQQIGSVRLSDTTAKITAWPAWLNNNPRCYQLENTIGKLDTNRASFKFDASNLPPAPPEDVVPPDGSHPLMQGPDQRPVLFGFEGGEPTFKVTSDGSTLTATYKDHPQPSPNDLKAIDRIVLYNDPATTDNAPRLGIAIFPGSLDKLQVDDPGSPTAVLRATGKFRCWLPSADVQTQQFDFSIQHETTRQPGRKPLQFSKLTFRDMAADQPQPFRVTDLLNRSFTESKPAGFSFPAIAAAVGLKGPGIVPNPASFERRLDFISPSVPNVSSDCEVQSNSSDATKLLHLRVSLDTPIDGNQELKPLPIAFDATEMPMRGGTAFAVLSARQPNSLNTKDSFGDHWIFESQFPQHTALTLWNEKVVDPVINALHRVKNGSPASVLPELLPGAASGQPPVWLARYSVIDRTSDAQVDSDRIVAGLPGQTATDKKVTFVPRVLTPDLTSTEISRTVNAQLHGLITTDVSAQPLSSRLQLFDRFENEADPTTALDNSIPSFQFGVWQRQPVIGTPPIPDPQQVRMGALDLVFLPSRRLSSSTSDDIPNLPGQAESLLLAAFSNKFYDIALLDVSYSLKVLGFQPGGQDDVPGDDFSNDLGASAGSSDQYRAAFERGPAILISPKLDSPMESPFVLTVREMARVGKSESLDLTLRTFGQSGSVGAGDKDVIVLDPEPLLISKVHVEQFEQSLALTNEIGHWSNSTDSGTGWEMSAGAAGFDLILPPQGVGETMHRSVDARDLEPGKPADFRFTPPTIANLQPSYFRQRFADAPWNLRRILGYPGQRAPGAGVNSIRFELLYGLPGQISASFLRLAEVASRLGQYAGQQPPSLPWTFSTNQCRQYTLFRKLWSDLFPSLRKRLAALEPYDPDRPSELLLRDPDGLSFHLRSEADLRYPIRNAQPMPGEIIPNNPDGLAGSFAWAFESNNIYRAVWNVPRSNTAQLTRPYFSALGGWAHQKATFDNRRTAICSEITMGRLATLNIERLGRIGVFRNRAKHVIVYRRTVAASRQFFLEQYPFRGNAVVRKVDEYIELLEAERSFPDTNAQPLTRGPVLACRFAGEKPPRIRVNSRWGEDVGTNGWKIPLWLRGAAPGDVYPKPQISLSCAGLQGEVVPVAIDEPEKLYFYTSTDPNLTDDTDAWPSVFGVDFGILPTEAVTPPAAGATGDPTQFPATDERYVKAGMSPFTLALAPSPKPVDMVAGRAPDPITASLRNVTMMRGAVIQDLGGDYAALLGLSDSLANALNPVLATLARDTSLFTGDVDGLLTPVKQGLIALLAAAQSLATKIDPTKEIDELTRRLLSQIDFVEGQIRQEVNNTLWRLNSDFLDAIADLRIKNFPDVKDELQARLLELIEGDEAFDGYRSFIRSLPGTIGEVIKQLDLAVDRIKDSALTFRQQAFSTECEVCKLSGWTTPDPPGEAKQLLADHYDQACESLREIEFLIAEMPRQWVGDRLDTLRRDLRTDLMGIQNLSRKLRFDALSLGGLTQANALLGLDKIVTAGQQLEDNAIQRLQMLRDALDALAAPGIDGILDQFLTKFADTLGATDWHNFDTQLQKALSDFTSSLPGKLTPLLDAFRTGMSDLALVRKLYDLVFPTVADLKAQLALLFDGTLIATLADLFKNIDVAKLQSNYLSDELEKLYTSLVRDLAEFANRLNLLIKPPALSIPPIELDTIRLFRSFGDPPRLPSLNFPPIPNLPGLSCGYYFFDPIEFKDLPSVNLTPILAKANELADDVLNAIHIQLPTTEILDRFKPFSLDQFDLSKLFPNFAGLKLDSLFQNLRPPAFANDHVKVTHGEDPQNRSGWLQVDVDFPLTQPATVFSLAGVTLRILTAQFKATSRIDAKAGQSPRLASRGSITGDWDLQIGGLPIAVLASTTLEFADDGKIHFNVSPDRIKLQQVLAFLADLLSTFDYGDKGFSVAVTPSGIRTVLDLPLPDVQAGAFGLANLRLGFLFALEIVPDFRITAQLSVARKEAPFTLTIFILGGSGYLDFGITYVPGTGEFVTFVDMAIMASASLAIALGPIKGGIYAYFGLTVDYQGSNRSPSRLAMGLLLMFVGEVSLLGIISVGLRLGLEAQYSSGGGLKGRGFVSYSIKICWFLTIDVHAEVEYTFGSSGGARLLDAKRTTSTAFPSYQQVAQDYIDMFA